MKNLLIITTILSFYLSSVVAATSYTCKTDPNSNRQVHSKGTLSFTDQIVKKQRRITNIKAYIRTDWSELSPIPAEDDEYMGEYDLSILTENPDYRPTVYFNHSQFQNFNATKSNSGMWGNLVLEKPKTNKPMKVHYIFQAGDHIGGVIDFICTKDNATAAPVTVPSPYYQSVSKLKAILTEAVRSLSDTKIIEKLGTNGGTLILNYNQGHYSIGTGKCHLGFDITTTHTNRVGPIPFKVTRNTVEDVNCALHHY